jgi:uncharacterized membrane protein
MKAMDCYFHANVPSVAPCVECGKPICATCRDDRGTCPSCRLAEKIDAATGVKQSLHGQVPPRPQAPPQPRATATIAPLSDDPVESRALVALGYPLFPLALLSLFDRKQSKYLKRQAYQAIGFNLGFAGFWGVLQLLSNVPWLGVSADVMIPFLIPVFLIASVYYGIKVWHGDEVHVPVLSSWLDEKMPVDP